MTKSGKEKRVFNIASRSVRVERGRHGAALRAHATGAALQDANSSCDAQQQPDKTKQVPQKAPVCILLYYKTIHTQLAR